jgi:thiamine-phosphate pyrophosphorylase
MLGTQAAEMMPSSPPRVYLVTDPSAGPGLVPRVEVALRGLPAGVVAVQLRAKGLPAAELVALARALRAVAAGAGQRLLVNDRLDVALAAGADGVHLPAAGIPPAEARRLAGPGRLVAVSCHSAADVAAARDAGADFATFGPIFDTPSKRGYGPPVGLAALAGAVALGLPLVGLGGVHAGNAPSVAAAGAAGVAAIRAWLDAPDPGGAVRQLLAAFGRGPG